MERRRFLTRAAALAALPLADSAAASAAEAAFIDTNVTLGSWPTRHSPFSTPDRLAAKLRQHGVTAAWVAASDAVLHTDLAGANARLAADCADARRDGLLRPFGTVNPTLPDWAEDLRRCHEFHQMPGIRLYPNYHGYGLDDARFASLLAEAAGRGLLVQIALTMEDDRTPNPMLVAAPVNVAPLADLLPKIPAARVMLLNSTSRLLSGGSPLLARLVKAGVYFEIATLEGVAGIETLLGRQPDLQLAFGSYTPYYYFEAALLKLQESILPPAQLAAIRHGWATTALSRP